MHNVKRCLVLSQVILGLLARNEAIPDVRTLRYPERFQSVHLGDMICVVSGSSVMAVAPSFQDTYGYGRVTSLLVYSVRGVVERLDGRWTYISPHGSAGYIHAGGVTIPVSFDASYNVTALGGPIITEEDHALRSSTSELATYVFSDYRLSLACSPTDVDPFLPAIQHLPYPERPFVFLHIDKTAGTKLRRVLYDSATALGVHSYIPCYGGVHCVLFSYHSSAGVTDIDTGISVVAGHFEWDVWKGLPALGSNPNVHDNRNSAPPCFIMFRDPVSRAVSYYYQRVYVPGHEIYGLKLNEMSTDHLSFILKVMRHPSVLADNITTILTDEGMSDAACRQILGLRQTTAKPIEYQVPSNAEVLSEGGAELAYANAKQCIVGIQEDMQSTYRVLKHWFPWIRMNETEYVARHNRGKRPDVQELLRPDIIRTIQEVNQCDIQLYRKVQRRFYQQVMTMSASS